MNDFDALIQLVTIPCRFFVLIAGNCDAFFCLREIQQEQNSSQELNIKWVIVTP
jgi:hypothetical protein